MLMYNVMQVSIGTSVNHYLTYESIIKIGEDFGHIFAIRNLEGKLTTANKELFLEVMEERGFVELREHPIPDDFTRYYTFLVTRAYAD